jgi:hypothetical protein
MRAMSEVKLSAFQQRVMELPEDVNVALVGGRGGGKSFLCGLLILRHCVQYGPKSKILFVRPTNSGLDDVANILKDIFFKAFGSGNVKYNQTSGKWTLPTGSTLELTHLEPDASGYQTYANTIQGRSFSQIYVDEFGAYPTDRVLSLLKSNVRAELGVPTRCIVAANPGGPGHQHVYRKFITKALPWTPWEDEHGELWCTCPSTFRDNEFIDQEDYARKLASSTSNDPELARAWLAGDWNIAKGAFLGGVLDEKRNLIPAWPKDSIRHLNADAPGGVARNGVKLAFPIELDPWRFYLSMDFGVAAPTVVYLCAVSPGANGPDGRFYPRGSVLLIDEYTTALKDDPSRGNGFTVPQLAERIKAMCADWHVVPRGVADDAIWNTTGSGMNQGHSHCIGDEFSDNGCYFRHARKGSRLGGWSLLRTMMADAGSIDKPGFYVSDRCQYFWETAPVAPRSQRNPEDLDTNCVDHALDAARYALGYVFNSRPMRDINI